MTWKAYVAVSGATVLAGWFAASPPENVPAGVPAAAPEPAGTTGPSAIELEAARLQARVRQEIEFQSPQRNPFRFSASRPSSISSPATAPPEPVVVPDAPAAPAPPPFSLSGIAENQVGERTERTAILSSPAGVLLVKEGEQVGQFRIGR